MSVSSRDSDPSSKSAEPVTGATLHPKDTDALADHNAPDDHDALAHRNVQVHPLDHRRSDNRGDNGWVTPIDLDDHTTVAESRRLSQRYRYNR